MCEYDIGVGPRVLIRDGGADFSFLPKRDCDPSGLSVWPMSMYLAQFLSSHLNPTGPFGVWSGPPLAKGLKAIEIGCGVSPLPSIASQRLGFVTIASDYNPEALKVAQDNIERAGVQVKVLRISWLDRPREHQAQFDLLIASDILYDDDVLPQLAGFLSFCAAAGATLTVGLKIRNRAFEESFVTRTLADQGWDVVTTLYFVAIGSQCQAVVKPEVEWRPLDYIEVDKYKIVVLTKRA